MKRSTAISRLTDVVEALDRAVSWPETTIVAAFLYGALLDGETDLERVELALVVDEPAETLPWMARPAHLEALAAILRFPKLPLSWCWRPTEWPVWNHAIERALRFWTAQEGGDQRVVDSLISGTVVVESPASRADLLAQLRIERAVGRRHLAMLTRCFYDQDWRRDYRGDGVHPEDHLWWAAAGFLELDDAIGNLDR